MDEELEALRKQALSRNSSPTRGQAGGDVEHHQILFSEKGGYT